ncbi:hypothetical protein HG535_0C04400 [Zygotorulaspora mrakii]|uniref:Arf3-interacting protein 1 N-terminal domain-containing protein n=1 Tax=Zygotorulaspora mrakii TaxID=42260 RepID=A0A7H9B0Z5_ZYGMR|nr:uncharacterized protein HG535_0C04400 [Zygotorulaspora mrakii]QLG72086.1 hypothetical protein HG535_0C04400 [Zygotorulaspora mrakii]
MTDPERKPYIPPETNVEYVIMAEFDNKYGHTLKYQYPHYIPGFESSIEMSSQSKNALYLASLMMPSNVEHNLSTGAVDFTNFMLYFNYKSKCYELLPSAANNPEDTIFFLSVVKAEENTKDARGAKIKAVAFGTRLKCSKSFKPIIQLTLENLMRYDTYGTTVPFLIDFYNSINSIDLSFVKQIHENRALQNIFSGINSEHSLRDVMDKSSDKQHEILQFLNIPDRDKYGNRIELIKGHLTISYDAYKPREPFRNFNRRPLLIDLIQDTPMGITIKYNNLVANFLSKLIPLLRKGDIIKTSLKIIINSKQLPKYEICEFVLALSSLMGCLSSANIMQNCRNERVVILPYMEVGMLDLIKQYFSSMQSENVIAIIGTANPIFKLQSNLWDFYYDVDTDTIIEFNKEKAAGFQKKLESLSLKKMLNRRNSTLSVSLMDTHIDSSLMTIFLEIISLEKTNNSTIIQILRKINLFQSLNRNIFKTDIASDNVLDEYLTSYRDFIFFDDLFTNESLKVARLLDSLSDMVNTIFDSQESSQIPYQPLNGKMVLRMNEILHEIYEYLSNGNSSLEIFLSVCLSFPLVTTTENSMYSAASFGNINNASAMNNFAKTILHNLRINNSWVHLVDSNIHDTASETFAKDRSLNLLFFPLLLNSEVKEKPVEYMYSEETPASSVNERPRSVAFKWMLNIANNKTLDNSMESSSVKSSSEAYSISSVPTSKLISPILSNDSSLSIKMDYEEIQQLVTISKNISFRILQLIENHAIGKVMLEQNLHAYFQLVYHCMKLQQRNDFTNYEIRLSKTEHSFRPMLHGDQQERR